MVAGRGSGDENSSLRGLAAGRKSATLCLAEWVRALTGRQPTKTSQPAETLLPEPQPPVRLRHAQRTSNEQWRREGSTAACPLDVNSASPGDVLVFHHSKHKHKPGTAKSASPAAVLPECSQNAEVIRGVVRVLPSQS